MFLGCCAVYAARTVIPLVVPDVAAELGWSSVLVGYVLSFFFWGYAMTQVHTDSCCCYVVAMGQELYPLGTKVLIVLCQSESVVRQSSRSDTRDIRPSVTNETRVVRTD